MPSQRAATAIIPAESPAKPQDRQSEARFFVERYHRAFQFEMALLTRLLDGDRLKARCPAADVLAERFAALAQRLEAHAGLQERATFPHLAADEVPMEIVDAWLEDAATLIVAADAVRVAAVDRVGTLGTATPLLARVQHLLDEIGRHLIEELRTLSAWVGAGLV